MPFWWSSGRWRPGLARALLGHIHPVDATKATADGDELAAVNSFQVASWACETLPECLRCLMGLPEACRSMCKTRRGTHRGEWEKSGTEARSVSAQLV